MRLPYIPELGGAGLRSLEIFVTFNVELPAFRCQQAFAGPIDFVAIDLRLSPLMTLVRESTKVEGCYGAHE